MKMKKKYKKKHNIKIMIIKNNTTIKDINIYFGHNSDIVLMFSVDCILNFAQNDLAFLNCVLHTRLVKRNSDESA
jgi:hypothetical protein